MLGPLPGCGRSGLEGHLQLLPALLLEEVGVHVEAGLRRAVVEDQQQARLWRWLGPQAAVAQDSLDHLCLMYR